MVSTQTAHKFLLPREIELISFVGFFYLRNERIIAGKPVMLKILSFSRIFILWIFVAISSNLTYQQIAIADDHNSNNESMEMLYENHQFDKIWAIIENKSINGYPELAFEKGMLLGSGVLSRGIDRCAAVYALESALAAGHSYVRPALDALYFGNWVILASIEGNRIALFELGIDYLNNDNTERNPFFSLNRSYMNEFALEALVRSARLGYRKAEEKILMVWPEYQNISEIGIGDNIKFNNVLCQVRHQ